MEQSQLSLYSQEITQSRLVTPIVKSANPKHISYALTPQQALNYAAKTLFSQDMQDSVLLRTRKALGQVAVTLTDDQLETIITEFNFLINSWMDEFEKEVFSGLTLREVVNNR